MLESEMKPIWWLPTIGFFFFLSIELWMFTGPKIFEDPGVGRHLRTAEFILETGRIPHTRPPQLTKGGEPWFDFEWAFETTLGELYRAGGLALVCAFCYALFAATLLGVYRTLLQSGLSSIVLLLATGLAYLTLHLHFSARPVLFTYLFMALVIEVWRRNPRPRLREWIILPIVFAFWANLHAGWSAALVFLAGSIVGRVLDRLIAPPGAEKPPLAPWIGLTALCGLATLLNPWGWALHPHVVLMATSFKSFALWDEYLPPNFSSLSMSAITIIAILVVVFPARIFPRVPRWSSGEKAAPWETAGPILFFLYEGLKAQRHVILLAEIAAVPVARDLQALLQIPWPRLLRARYPDLFELGDALGELLDDFQARQRVAGADAWLAIVAALALTGLFLRAPISHNIQVGSSVTPNLVAFLRDHPDRFHRTLTTTWNAGPLLWNMRPDFRVSFDDRGDFYGDDTVFAYVAMTGGQPGWQKTLEAGNYDSALLDPYLQLNNLLRKLPGWKEVYRDDHVVALLERPLSPNPFNLVNPVKKPLPTDPAQNQSPPR